MKKPIECDVLVAGGGVAGLSTAWHLAQGTGKLRVIVVEREKKLGGHASGRNAGMIRQALSDPVLVRLARQGREALERAASLKSWKTLKLRPAGSLLLDDRKKSPELAKTAAALAGESIAASLLTPDDARALVPALDPSIYREALYCPSDAVLDIHELVRGFEKELARFGVPIVRGAPIRRVRKSGVLFEVDAGPHAFRTQVIVDAAGAWASEIGRLAGASDLPLTAYRRHLFETPSLPGVSRRSPFVWHVNREFYFRPLEKGYLVSPCDKTPVGNDEGEKVDPAMAKRLLEKLAAASPNFKRVKLVRPRSGLRTMTPDGRFVVGVDPKLFGFFWVAGLGGHGVTTCFSVGRLAADLIIGRKVDAKTQRAFSPGRFAA